ncbi:Superfamily II DNA and RNA helicase [Giardia duodenalis assemblage B]|uniref:Superfamily II DNA and RNA helicase n=2 Tax=Giardia intestinalis TaxID=5741 RepID=A0A132NS06_GIAIN|nr:Superfamily II DNA and RNA helicase [Giardia intestinalis]KWX12861.1 Superfamily II DNA and RNA helicase [Giardia intestinalis assemblage B]
MQSSPSGVSKCILSSTALDGGCYLFLVERYISSGADTVSSIYFLA